MQVEIDSAKCQSHTRCMAVAPAVFGIDDDGKATLLDPHGAEDAVVLKAAKSCPYRAIAVRDESTAEQLWPKT